MFVSFLLILVAIGNSWEYFFQEIAGYLFVCACGSLYAAALAEPFLSINEAIDDMYDRLMQKIHGDKE